MYAFQIEKNFGNVAENVPVDFQLEILGSVGCTKLNWRRN